MVSLPRAKNRRSPPSDKSPSAPPSELRSSLTPSDPDWQRPKELSLCWSSLWVLTPVFIAAIFPPIDLPLAAALSTMTALSMFYWYNKTRLFRSGGTLVARIQTCYVVSEVKHVISTVWERNSLTGWPVSHLS